MTNQELSDQFLDFERYCASSPLYARLSRAVAADDDLLALAARVQSNQPRPNLLFAAVHFLLLSGLTHPLAGFYPSLDGTNDGDPTREFRDFCEKYDAEIGELLATRRVQTNEVRRCTVLLPAFAHIAKTLNLIEIGTSAGLNLLWEKYAYDYGSAGKIGAGKLTLTCEARGSVPIPEAMPTVTSRIGLDLNPVDVTDVDAVLWLRALIWPEHTEREKRLTQAVEIVRQNPPEMRAGDALELLPQAFADTPSDGTLTVFHSFTVYQFSPEMREKLRKIFRQQSQKRDFFVVGLEVNAGVPHAHLTLTTWKNGTSAKKILADAEQHGAWLHWL